MIAFVGVLYFGWTCLNDLKSKPSFAIAKYNLLADIMVPLMLPVADIITKSDINAAPLDPKIIEAVSDATI